MKKRNLLHSGVLALLLTACSTTPQSGKQEGQIDIKLEGTLAPLKDLGDDANPVVVIVEP